MAGFNNTSRYPDGTTEMSHSEEQTLHVLGLIQLKSLARSLAGSGNDRFSGTYSQPGTRRAIVKTIVYCSRRGSAEGRACLFRVFNGVQSHLAPFSKARTGQTSTEAAVLPPFLCRVWPTRLTELRQILVLLQMESSPEGCALLVDCQLTRNYLVWKGEGMTDMARYE